MFRRLAFFLAVALVVSNSGQAATVSVTLDKFRENQTKPNMKGLNGLYLDGVREGLVTAAALMPDQAAPFCLPGQLALTVEQAEDIMLRFADEYKIKGDIPIAIILFAGLKSTFPCPSKK